MGSRYYFELRFPNLQPAASLGADIARHLHTRKHLGKAIVVCQNPVSLMSTTRKQWLKLARGVQKQRAGTLNADRILRYTHAITHMQHMIFVTRPPAQHPDAHIYFVTPDRLTDPPLSCYSLYVATPIPTEDIRPIIQQLPASALIVDYTNSMAPADLGLYPKQQLENQVETVWQTVEAFLTNHHIFMSKLLPAGLQDTAAVNDALDTLLGISHEFLSIASNFQHVRDLAQPLPFKNAEQQRYEMLSLLAHRVQALTPGAYLPQFSDAFHEEETYFLHDSAEENIEEVDFTQTIHQHRVAGRHHLAKALERLPLV